MTLGLDVASTGSPNTRTKLCVNVGSGSQRLDLFSNKVIVDGQWHHIAVVFDRTSGLTARIYIDGVLDNSTSNSSFTSTLTTALSVRLMCDADLGVAHTAGSLDEVRMWNSALTLAQIQANMFSSISNPESNAGLKFYVNFDQNLGTTVFEQANQTSATLSNFANTGTSSTWVDSYAALKVSGLASTSACGNSLTFSWTGITGKSGLTYQIDVATDAAFTSMVSGYTQFSVGTNSSVTVTGLAANTTYYARVRARNTATLGYSYWSNSVSASTVQPSIPVISSSDISTFCINNSATLIAPLSGAYIWSTGASARSITVTTPGIYTVRVVNGICTSSTSASTIINNCGNVFTGNGTWSNSGRWNTGSAPSSSSSALVGSGTATINGSVNIGDLQVYSGATINIPTTSDTLFVNGDLLNNGNITGPGFIKFNGTSGSQNIQTNTSLKNVVINNTSGVGVTGTLTISGILVLERGTLTSNSNVILGANANDRSIVVHKAGTVTGNIKVQGYIAGTTVRAARHISSPLASGLYTDLLASDANATVETWNETAYNGTVGSGWQAFTGPSMTVGKGYSYKTTGNSTFTLQGALNNGNYTVNLTRTGTNGWNLIGNPYAAPVDWDAVVSDAAFTGVTNMSTAKFSWVSANGVTGVWMPYVNGFPSSRNIIPVMGAVLVRAYNNTTLTFKNNHRLTTSTGSNLARIASTDSRPAIYLNLTGTSGTDEAIIYFQEGATIASNGAFDATKISLNPVPMPSLYSKSDNFSFAIKGLPIPVLGAVQMIPLTAKINTAGTYTITPSQVLNFDEYEYALVDSSTGIVQNLRTNPDYQFQANAGLISNRFYLRINHMHSVTTVKDISTIQVKFWPNPVTDNLVKYTVNTENPADLTFTVTNALGQIVLTQTAQTTETEKEGILNLNRVKTGIYFITVQNGNTKSIHRVVIK